MTPALPQRLWLWLAPLTFAAVILAQSFFQIFINAPQPRHAVIKGTDGQAYYAFVRSLVVDGDLDFENEFFQYNYNRHGFQTPDFLPRSPHTGLYFNRFPVGYSLLTAPLFLAAHGLTALGNVVGVWDFTADGYSPPYQVMALLNGWLWALLAFCLTQFLLSRFLSAPWAAGVTLAFFLSFPGQYSAIEFWCNPMLMTLAAFCLLALLGMAIEKRGGDWRLWAALGAAQGVLALLRTELALLCLYTAGLALWYSFRCSPGGMDRLKAFLWRGLISGGVFGAVFFLQLLVWRLMWGQWFHLAMNNSAEGFNWTRPVFLKVLFSTRHGLFYWSPVFLAALPGLWLLWRRSGPALRIWMLMLLPLWYLYASWKIWWMGYSFGARQFIVVSPIFCLALGLLMERWRKPAWAAPALLALLVLWNQVMLWLFLNGHIPRSEGFPPLLPLKKAAALVLEKF